MLYKEIQVWTNLLQINCDYIDLTVNHYRAFWAGRKTGLIHFNQSSCRMGEVWRLENIVYKPMDGPVLDWPQCQWIGLKCHRWRRSKLLRATTLGSCTVQNVAQSRYHDHQKYSMHMKHDFTQLQKEIRYSCSNQIVPKLSCLAGTNCSRSLANLPEQVLQRIGQKKF